MPTNHTVNYQLSQWERTDKVQMEDFNADNAKIDEVLEEHTAKLATCGNCQIGLTSYVGTGLYGEANPNTLTFPRKPAIVFVGISSPYMLNIFPCDASYTVSGVYHNIRWEGNTLIWYCGKKEYQLNVQGTTYYVIAFWPVDE